MMGEQASSFAALVEWSDVWCRCVLAIAWQSPLVVAVALLVVRLGKRWPSPLRYAILLVALLKFATPPFLSLPTGVFSSFRWATEVNSANAPARIAVSSVSDSQSPPSARETLTGATTEELDLEQSRLDRSRSDRESTEEAVSSPAQAEVGTLAEAGVSSEAEVSMDAVIVNPVDPNHGRIADERRTAPIEDDDSLHGWIPIGLFLLHVTGILAWSLWAGRSVLRLSAARRRACGDVPDRLLDDYASMLSRLGLSRGPQLLVSDEICVPISFGIFRPVIMVPTKLMAMERSVRRSALAHEIAHHRRHDPWINLMQNLLFVFWWFHPAIYLLNRSIRRVREECCDDLLLASGVATADEYSQALLRIARANRNADPAYATALGMSARHPLGDRIGRILDRGISRHPRLKPAGAIVAVAAALVLLPGLRSVSVADPPTESESAAVEQDAATVTDSPPSEPRQGESTIEVSVATEVAVGDEIVLSGRVVDEDGKGVSRAEVVIDANRYSRTRKEYEHREFGRATCRQDGTFTVRRDVSDFDSEIIRLATISASHPGGAFGWQDITDVFRSLKHDDYRRLRAAGELEPITLEVRPRRDLKVRLVDASGMPIAAARVEVVELFKTSFADYKNTVTSASRLPSPLSLPEETRPSADSDAEGRCTLPGVPPTGVARLRLMLSDRPLEFSAAVGCESEETTIVLNDSATLRGEVRCADPSFDKSMTRIRARLYDSTGTQSGAEVPYMLTLDTTETVRSDGSFEVKNLVPGEYRISMSIEAQEDGIYYCDESFRRVTVTSEPGDPLEFEVEKGVSVSGRFVDAETGEGIEGVECSLGLMITEIAYGSYREIDQVSSDDNGFFIGRGRPGEMLIRVNRAPTTHWNLHHLGFRDPLPSIQIAEQAEQAAFPEIKLTRVATLSGVVVDKDGKPQAGAKVVRVDLGTSNRTVTTDEHGRFLLEQLDARGTTSLRAANGDAVTDGASLVNLPGRREDVRLVVDPTNAFRVAGRIADQSGRPILAAEIRLMWTRRLADSGMFNKSPYRSLFSDRDGRFSATGLWPDDSYQINVTVEGYTDHSSATVRGEAGKTHDFGEIALTGTRRVVTGQVRDSAGAPVVGAEVFSRGDGPASVSSLTTAGGRFTLSGLTDGPIFVFARKEGMFTGRWLSDSTDRILLILNRRDQGADEVKNAALLAPLPYARRKALAEPLLRKLHEFPRTQRAPLEPTILISMARVDPDTALAWVNEPDNQKWRDEVRLTIAESVLDQDPARAFTLARQVVSDGYFGRIVKIAERLSTKSPAMAFRLADELEERAGRYPLLLSETGRLLIDLGAEREGQALLKRALEGVRGASDELLSARVRYGTAINLATHDLTAALELADFGREIDREHTRGAIAAAIARSDPARAAELSKGLDGSLVVRIAYRMADTDPGRAIALLNEFQGRGSERVRTEGFAWIAMARHDTHPDQAYDLMDRAFDVVANKSLGGWSNYRAEATPAAHLAVLARRMDYPDMSGAVMRAIASRRDKSIERSWQAAEFDQAKMSKYIALVDRRAARQLLQQLQHRNDLLDVSNAYGTMRDDWLLAWCLTDEERGKREFFEAIDRELKRNGGVFDSRGAIATVIARLTLPDEQLHATLARDEALWFP